MSKSNFTEKYGCFLQMVAVPILLLTIFIILSEFYDEGVAWLILFFILLTLFFYFNQFFRSSPNHKRSKLRKAFNAISWTLIIVFIFIGLPKILLYFFGFGVAENYVAVISLVLLIWISISTYKRSRERNTLREYDDY